MALALLAAGCTGRANASANGSAVLPFNSPVPVGVSAVVPAAGVEEPLLGGGRAFVPLADGGTDIGYDDGRLFVEAGEKGSLSLVDIPGAVTVGRRVRCTWHALTGSASLPSWDRNVPVIPEPGEVYVLRCIYPDEGSDVAGYPRLTPYDPADPIAGSVVGVVEVGKFAVDSIMFETPVPALSPPGHQIVGVSTWLGVTSRLNYRDVAAQAGDAWVKVHPVLRDATWNLGDGTVVRCRADIDKTWNPAGTAVSQSTTCSNNFERVSGPSPFAGEVAVAWVIYEITNEHPAVWTVWGVVERTAPVGFDVGELQSVIR